MPRPTKMMQRKKPLRRFSKKRERANRLIKPARDLFKEESLCCLCQAWSRRPNIVLALATDSLDVHEVFGGSVRQSTVQDRRYWLAVCRAHHGALQGMPKAEQMALKALCDEAYYDRSMLKELKGGEVLSEIDVIQAAYRLGHG